MNIIFLKTTQEQIKLYMILKSCFALNIPALMGNEPIILNVNKNNNNYLHFRLTI
jgi:hypothetical protein